LRETLARFSIGWNVVKSGLEMAENCTKIALLKNCRLDQYQSLATLKIILIAKEAWQA
jgi:hypothetical protein